jgi:hypothetical protein
MTSIGPYISKFHSGFIGNEAFAQNVFYLGGVPRLLTDFAKKISSIPDKNMIEPSLRNVRMAVLANLQFPQLSFSDILKFLAISFTNTPVLKVLDIAYSNSHLESKLTWSQMISNGVCLLQDNGCVIVPFHFVAQVLDILPSQFDELNEYEKALVLSLKDLSENVDVSMYSRPSWLTWESLGARFYSIRINSFLVLGQDKVTISSLIRGSRFLDDQFEVVVRLKIAIVIQSNVAYGPEMPRTITPKGSYYSVDCIESEFVYVVLNCENGPGVDVFLILSRGDNILLLDQRKLYSSNVTNYVISSIKSKIPAIPKCIDGAVEIALGIMSIYSQINIEQIPKSAFFVSCTDSSFIQVSLRRLM